MILIPHFLTEQEQQQVLSHIRPGRKVQTPTRNRILRYGSPLPYTAPMQSREIPHWLLPVCAKVAEQWAKLEIPAPDHVTINEYQKGQSIDWHIDSETSGPVITVISLGSSAVMGLKSPEGVESNYILDPGSLLQLTGDERWRYKHCIFPVGDLRYSLVFRKGTKKK